MNRLFFKFLCLTIIIFNFSYFSFTEETKIYLEKIGTFQCGEQPKQVLFSPDGKKIVLPLLDDQGFDVFDVSNGKMQSRICPPNSSQKGFAEGLFIPEKNAFFVSQMTTGLIYEYSATDFKFRREINTHGVWSKFIAWSPEKSLLAVSNWVSNDISLIDYETGTVVKKIKTASAPRGMIFVDEGENLISLSFEGGRIEKFSVSSGDLIDSIYVEKSAMRHVVVDSLFKTAYVSDMYHRNIFSIDLDSFEIKNKIRVFSNPNTIDLLDGRWLFVSSRGPNNPTDYTLRSPENGRITIIDTKTMTVALEIQGGNQPTGLDISPDGKILCFSNFQDANLELYKIILEK